MPKLSDAMRKTLRNALDRWRGFSADAPVVAYGARGVCILSSEDNASIRYFVEPYIALAQLDSGPVRLLNRESAREGCHTVVVARYLPKAWIHPLQAFRLRGGRVVYFMDDDLMDPAATVTLPRAYARKIRVLATEQRAILESLCDEFWVASDYLAKKYAAWSPKVLNPSAARSELDNVVATSVCYHGTASHTVELGWLVPVIAQVQSQSVLTRFEIFGDHNVNKLYRGLPGVSILHPMSWSNYLAYSGAVQRDIALAPLLPQPFNLGRGPTKFFDFARMGAVGIYTDVAPYRGFIQDGIDGVLLPNDPELWVRTIVELAADEPRRRRMADAARRRALAMAWDGRAGQHDPVHAGTPSGDAKENQTQ